MRALLYLYWIGLQFLVLFRQRIWEKSGNNYLSITLRFKEKNRKSNTIKIYNRQLLNWYERSYCVESLLRRRGDWSEELVSWNFREVWSGSSILILKLSLVTRRLISKWLRLIGRPDLAIQVMWLLFMGISQIESLCQQAVKFRLNYYTPKY